MEAYKTLVQERYLEFFKSTNAVYMLEDDKQPPHYVGIAFEFLCEISSSNLKVDYNDLYDNVFRDEKWLYVDALEVLSDEFVASLTAIQVVTMLASIRHKELFCTGFFSLCGKTGTIYRLLKQLERELRKKDEI